MIRASASGWEFMMKRPVEDSGMRKLSLMPIAVAILITGCTMEPHYDRPDAPVTATFPNDGVYQTQPRAESGKRSANGQAAPDIGWRNFFIDPRLLQYMQSVRAESFDRSHALASDLRNRSRA